MKWTFFLLLVTAGCQSVPGRCPASALPKSNGLCVGVFAEPKIEDFDLSGPPPSMANLTSVATVASLDRMNIPFAVYEANGFKDVKTWIVEFTYTQFADALRAVPGGSELVQILQDPSNAYSSTEGLRKRLDDWTALHLPGYKLDWAAPHEDTFVQEADYFGIVGGRSIPITTHHDVLSHLFLFSDPEIRALTERLAPLYKKALNYDQQHHLTLADSGVKSLINATWVRLQEFTPLSYTDSEGNARIAIVGGGPSTENPLDPARGRLEFWIYTYRLATLMMTLDGRMTAEGADSKASANYAALLGLLRQNLGLAPGAPLSAIVTAISKIEPSLDTAFAEISAHHDTYQSRWLELSKKVTQARPGDPWQMLKPETHRQILGQLIATLEALLAPY